MSVITIHEDLTPYHAMLIVRQLAQTGQCADITAQAMYGLAQRGTILSYRKNDSTFFEGQDFAAWLRTWVARGTYRAPITIVSFVTCTYCRSRNADTDRSCWYCGAPR